MESDLCPICLKGSIKSKLSLYNLNLKKAVYMCPKRDCVYPFGYSWTFVERKIISSDDDCSSISSRSIERDIENFDNHKNGERSIPQPSNRTVYTQELNYIDMLINKLHKSTNDRIINNVESINSSTVASFKNLHDRLLKVRADIKSSRDLEIASKTSSFKEISTTVENKFDDCKLSSQPGQSCDPSSINAESHSSNHLRDDKINFLSESMCLNEHSNFQKSHSNDSLNSGYNAEHRNTLLNKSTNESISFQNLNFGDMMKHYFHLFLMSEKAKCNSGADITRSQRMSLKRKRTDVRSSKNLVKTENRSKKVKLSSISKAHRKLSIKCETYEYLDNTKKLEIDQPEMEQSFNSKVIQFEDLKCETDGSNKSEPETASSLKLNRIEDDIHLSVSNEPKDEVEDSNYDFPKIISESVSLNKSLCETNFQDFLEQKDISNSTYTQTNLEIYRNVLIESNNSNMPKSLLTEQNNSANIIGSGNKSLNLVHQSGNKNSRKTQTEKLLNIHVGSQTNLILVSEQKNCDSFLLEENKKSGLIITSDQLDNKIVSSDRRSEYKESEINVKSVVACPISRQLKEHNKSISSSEMSLPARKVYFKSKSLIGSSDESKSHLNLRHESTDTLQSNEKPEVKLFLKNTETLLQKKIISEDKSINGCELEVNYNVRSKQKERESFVGLHSLTESNLEKSDSNVNKNDIIKQSAKPETTSAHKGKTNCNVIRRIAETKIKKKTEPFADLASMIESNLLGDTNSTENKNDVIKQSPKQKNSPACKGKNNCKINKTAEQTETNQKKRKCVNSPTKSNQLDKKFKLTNVPKIRINGKIVNKSEESIDISAIFKEYEMKSPLSPIPETYDENDGAVDIKVSDEILNPQLPNVEQPKTITSIPVEEIKSENNDSGNESYVDSEELNLTVANFIAHKISKNKPAVPEIDVPKTNVPIDTSVGKITEVVENNLKLTLGLDIKIDIPKEEIKCKSNDTGNMSPLPVLNQIDCIVKKDTIATSNNALINNAKITIINPKIAKQTGINGLKTVLNTKPNTNGSKVVILSNKLVNGASKLTPVNYIPWTGVNAINSGTKSKFSILNTKTSKKTRDIEMESEDDEDEDEMSSYSFLDSIKSKSSTKCRSIMKENRKAPRNHTKKTNFLQNVLEKSLLITKENLRLDNLSSKNKSVSVSNSENKFSKVPKNYSGFQFTTMKGSTETKLADVPNVKQNTDLENDLSDMLNTLDDSTPIELSKNNSETVEIDSWLQSLIT